jgi:FeS assembly protein IscX
VSPQRARRDGAARRRPQAQSSVLAVSPTGRRGKNTGVTAKLARLGHGWGGMTLTWDDPEDIAYELARAHPDTDPLDLSFVDLHGLVLDLADFGDDPDAASETKLEAIVLAWNDQL